MCTALEHYTQVEDQHLPVFAHCPPSSKWQELYFQYKMGCVFNQWNLPSVKKGRSCDKTSTSNLNSVHSKHLQSGATRIRDTEHTHILFNPQQHKQSSSSFCIHTHSLMSNNIQPIAHRVHFTEIHALLYPDETCPNYVEDWTWSCCLPMVIKCWSKCHVK